MRDRSSRVFVLPAAFLLSISLVFSALAAESHISDGIIEAAEPGGGTEDTAAESSLAAEDTISVDNTVTEAASENCAAEEDNASADDTVTEAASDNGDAEEDSTSADDTVTETASENGAAEEDSTSADDTVTEAASENSDDEEESQAAGSDSSFVLGADAEDLDAAVMDVGEWSGYIQSDSEFEKSIADFPESYKPYLRAIHKVYPNYTFKAKYIDLDFDDIVDAEKVKKVDTRTDPYSWRAVYDSSHGYYENYDFDSGSFLTSEGTFTYASREVIEYCVDPRSYLDTSHIYAFLNLCYSEEQTIDDLRSLISGTFLADGFKPVDKWDKYFTGDYAKLIMYAAEASNTSPLYIATSILLEHGSQGGTPLISGYYKTSYDTYDYLGEYWPAGSVFKNLYNFYDIGATGSTSENVIVNGLVYAYKQGWTSVSKSIYYGALWNADSYLNAGQNTYYFRDYNVSDGTLDNVWHQYATAVFSAYSSSNVLKSAFSGYTNAALDFIIPVYNNMPESTSLPAESNALNNYFFTNISVSGLSPSYQSSVTSYSLSVSGDTTIYVTIPEHAVYKGKTSYSCSAGTNKLKLKIKSQTGYTRTYTIKVTAAAACTINVQVGGYAKGDVNGDGVVNKTDYKLIAYHLMDLKVITDSELLKAADYNSDGVVNALDYVDLRLKLSGK